MFCNSAPIRNQVPSNSKTDTLILKQTCTIVMMNLAPQILRIFCLPFLLIITIVWYRNKW